MLFQPSLFVSKEKKHKAIKLDQQEGVKRGDKGRGKRSVIREGGKELNTNERAELVKERKSTKLESHFREGEEEGGGVLLLRRGLRGKFAHYCLWVWRGKDWRGSGKGGFFVERKTG